MKSTAAKTKVTGAGESIRFSNKFHYLNVIAPLIRLICKTYFSEYLDLTIDDVGERIELVYTPVRKDGTTGTPKIIISDIIVPGKYLLLGSHYFKNGYLHQLRC